MTTSLAPTDPPHPPEQLPEPPPIDPNDDDGGDVTLLARAPLAVLVATALVAGLTFFLFGGHEAFSVAVGGSIVAADVWAIGRIVRALLEPSGNTAFWAFLGLTKIFFLFGGLWWLLSSGLVTPVGLAAGIACLALGLVGAVLFHPRAPKS